MNDDPEMFSQGFAMPVLSMVIPLPLTSALEELNPLPRTMSLAVMCSVAVAEPCDVLNVEPAPTATEGDVTVQLPLLAKLLTLIKLLMVRLLLPSRETAVGESSATHVPVAGVKALKVRSAVPFPAERLSWPTL